MLIFFQIDWVTDIIDKSFAPRKTPSWIDLNCHRLIFDSRLMVFKHHVTRSYNLNSLCHGRCVANHKDKEWVELYEIFISIVVDSLLSFYYRFIGDFHASVLVLWSDSLLLTYFLNSSFVEIEYIVDNNATISETEIPPNSPCLRKN